MWIRITCFFCMSTMNFQKNNYIYIYFLCIYFCVSEKWVRFQLLLCLGLHPFYLDLRGMSGLCSETGWIVISHLARDLGLSFLFVHPSTFLSCFFLSSFFCFWFLVFGTERIVGQLQKTVHHHINLPLRIEESEHNEGGKYRT